MKSNLVILCAVLQFLACENIWKSVEEEGECGGGQVQVHQAEHRLRAPVNVLVVHLPHKILPGSYVVLFLTNRGWNS